MLGRFITIEGIDGAGKSTQTESLLKHLADQGVSVLHTREPGGTPLAEKIRVTGVPTLVVEGNMIQTLSESDIQRAIDEAKAAK